MTARDWSVTRLNRVPRTIGASGPLIVRPGLSAEPRRLVGGHLPLAPMLDINLQRANAERLTPHHLHLNKGRENRSLPIRHDLQVREREGFIFRRAGGDRLDVLALVLQLPAG